MNPIGNPFGHLWRILTFKPDVRIFQRGCEDLESKDSFKSHQLLMIIPDLLKPLWSCMRNKQRISSSRWTDYDHGTTTVPSTSYPSLSAIKEFQLKDIKLSSLYNCISTACLIADMFSYFIHGASHFILGAEKYWYYVIYQSRQVPPVVTLVCYYSW